MRDLIERVEAIRAIKEYADKHASNSYYNGMNRACKVLLTVPSAESEPSIPILWIEKHVDWLKNMDNGFAKLTAMNISTMVKKWKREREDE